VHPLTLKVRARRQPRRPAGANPRSAFITRAS
jgi:hypothetical protein